MHYLLKWVGYPDSDSSWEAASNLNCDDLVRDYWGRLKARKVELAKVLLGEPLSPGRKSKIAQELRPDSVAAIMRRVLASPLPDPSASARLRSALLSPARRKKTAPPRFSRFFDAASSPNPPRLSPSPSMALYVPAPHAALPCRGVDAIPGAEWRFVVRFADGTTANLSRAETSARYPAQLVEFYLRHVTVDEWPC
jgi:hypothetical protein